MNIIIALLVLGVIVVVHEFGHFITAKFFKMPVQEFAIGMGPYIYKYQGKKTAYTLRSIPVGGFVNIEGMEIDSKVEDGFNTKPAYARLIVLSAGVVMNFILAFVLIFVILFSQGKVNQNTEPVIGEVTKNSLAATVIKAQDKILEIQGVEIDDWSAIGVNISKNIENFKEKNIQEKKVELKIKRGEEVLSLIAPLTYDEVEKRYFLGITPEITKEKYTFPTAFADTKKVFKEVFLDTLKGFKQLIAGEVKKEEISGPLGIIKVVGDASKGGIVVLTWLTIMLSINIGIFNLIPFPALDGGRIIFLFLELIGINVNKKLEERVHMAGLIILMGLIIYITGNDIFNMMGK